MFGLFKKKQKKETKKIKKEITLNKIPEKDQIYICAYTGEDIKGKYHECESCGKKYDWDVVPDAMTNCVCEGKPLLYHEKSKITKLNHKIERLLEVADKVDGNKPMHSTVEPDLWSKSKQNEKTRYIESKVNECVMCGMVFINETENKCSICLCLLDNVKPCLESYDFSAYDITHVMISKSQSKIIKFKKTNNELFNYLLSKDGVILKNSEYDKLFSKDHNLIKNIYGFVLDNRYFVFRENIFLRNTKEIKKEYSRVSFMKIIYANIYNMGQWELYSDNIIKIPTQDAEDYRHDSVAYVNHFNNINTVNSYILMDNLK